MNNPPGPDRLLAPVSSEGEAFAALDGCVDRLHQVQATRAAVTRLHASGPRTAAQARRNALG